ncbi:hypothetical protein Tco_1186709 [Tanacetum coccineum]
MMVPLRGPRVRSLLMLPWKLKLSLLNALELQTAVDYHLMVSNVIPLTWKGHIDNQSKVELLDLQDRCYARQKREKARDRECEELRAKCEAMMADFDKNPVINVLRQKIKSLLDESRVAALEAEKGKLEAAEALLRKEIKDLKYDRAELVSRCAALEEVANMKEPFDMAKVKGYWPTYKKEHTNAGNNFVVATFPFISEVVADHSASVEALLSKETKSFCRPSPTKTNAPAPSAPSKKATPSSTPTPKPMSPPLTV